MINGLCFELSIPATKTFIFHSFSSIEKQVPVSVAPKNPPLFSASVFQLQASSSRGNPKSHYQRRRITFTWHSFVNQTPICKQIMSLRSNDTATTEMEEERGEIEVAEGYTMTQFCDKIIDFFMNEKTKTKEWRKYLVFREEWNKYKDSFYKLCQWRADMESDPIMKEKLNLLGRKVKRIDDEMESHTALLKELQDSPTDINAIVAKRRRDFTGEFFQFLTLISETHDGLEDRDAVARLGAKCLSAVSAYDKTLEDVEMMNSAQVKFDDILNSPSLDVACDKIKSLAKSKELDSSLILLINSAWASAKESATMKDEVKEIMYQLYKTTKSSLRTIVPKEIKLLKHLLNIIDPEERFSALATAFSPGDGNEVRDPKATYTTPKELHKWIKIMLDSYHLNQEDTDIREAKRLTQPVVIQRLFILKDTIEAEYLEQAGSQNAQTKVNPVSEDGESIF